MTLVSVRGDCGRNWKIGQRGKPVPDEKPTFVCLVGTFDVSTVL